MEDQIWIFFSQNLWVAGALLILLAVFIAAGTILEWGWLVRPRRRIRGNWINVLSVKAQNFLLAIIFAGLGIALLYVFFTGVIV